MTCNNLSLVTSRAPSFWTHGLVIGIEPCCYVYASRDFSNVTWHLQCALIESLADVTCVVCHVQNSVQFAQLASDLVYFVLSVCTRCKMYDNWFLTYVLLFYELFDAVLLFYCFGSTRTKTKSQLKNLRKSIVSPCQYPGLIYNTYTLALRVNFV